MSRTLHEAIATCRYHLRDWRVQDQAFIDPEVILELQSSVRFMAPQLLPGEQWQTAIVTLVDGTDTYTLAGASSQHYHTLRKLRIQESGLEVPIVSLEQFERWREGAVTTANSEPQIAMVFEGPDQLTKVRFWPTPGATGPVDGFRSMLPAAFYTAGTLALTALPAATTIPFDDQGFEALCWQASANLFRRMTPEKRAANGLSDDAAADWGQMAASLVRESRSRRLRQQSSNTVDRRREW